LGLSSINSSQGLLNNTKLRYYNEPVRHKLLDLLGDLCLLGIPIKGHVIAARSGHFANIELVKNIKRKYFNRGVDKKMTLKKQKISFDIREVLNILPHRYPCLLIDRISNLDPGKEVQAIKNVTFNEPFFQGHFPGQPVMPGVLLIESMAQAGGFLVLNTIPNPESKLMYISAIESTRFKKIVVPGDQLIIKAKLLKFKLNTCKIGATIHVNKELVAESTFLASVVNRSI
jgi:UDP-3-O-[3-hydroxymyristoyl] N-acetylglucosamine deacetylase/3-hydroxyacyl-[acyl-carrier-protein] dehydratase